MGVSENGGTPKWMVYNIKMDDLGVPLFLETSISWVVPLPRMQTWPNDPRLRLNLPPLIRTVEDAEGVAAIAEWSQLPSWQLNLKFRGENDAGGG